MLPTKDSNSIGLASNSSQPVAMAVSRSLSSAYADMPMIGMSQVCGSSLRRRTGSQRSTTAFRGPSELRSDAPPRPALLLRRENLEIAVPLKAHLEHVEVVVVVFDVEHFGHVAVSVSLGGRSAELIIRSPRSPRVPGR
jgi:hypothetical protein